MASNLSWVKGYLSTHNCTLEDRSTLDTYEATISAPDGYLLYGTGTKSHTLRMDRKKGSKKETFWYEAHVLLSVGVFHESVYDEWKKMNNTYEWHVNQGRIFSWGTT